MLQGNEEVQQQLQAAQQQAEQLQQQLQEQQQQAAERLQAAEEVLTLPSCKSLCIRIPLVGVPVYVQHQTVGLNTKLEYRCMPSIELESCRSAQSSLEATDCGGMYVWPGSHPSLHESGECMR